jgi:hypothetical protein
MRAPRDFTDDADSRVGGIRRHESLGARFNA